MGENGRWIGTKRWVKEFGRWVRRIPAHDAEWLERNCKVAQENSAPRPFHDRAPQKEKVEKSG